MSRRLLALLIGLALLLPTAGCTGGTDSGGCDVAPGENTFIDGAEARSFRISLPQGANMQTPMMVSLHPLNGSAAGQEEYSGFSAMGAAEGFIAVYPQGRGFNSEYVWDAAPGSEDVQTVAALIQSLHSQGCSSPASTYVTGFSMGAMMTARLLCEHSDLMAGAGMVAGVLPPELGCRVPGQTTIVIVHSRDDPTVPFDGSLSPVITDRAGGAALSSYPGLTRQAMGQQWAQAKGCPQTQAQTVRQPGQTVTRWTGCGDAPTVVHVYDSGRHDWNAGDPAVPGTSATLWRELSAG